MQIQAKKAKAAAPAPVAKKDFALVLFTPPSEQVALFFLLEAYLASDVECRISGDVSLYSNIFNVNAILYSTIFSQAKQKPLVSDAQHLWSSSGHEEALKG